MTRLGIDKPNVNMREEPRKSSIQIVSGAIRGMVYTFIQPRKDESIPGLHCKRGEMIRPESEIPAKNLPFQDPRHPTHHELNLESSTHVKDMVSNITWPPQKSDVNDPLLLDNPPLRKHPFHRLNNHPNRS